MLFRSSKIVRLATIIAVSLALALLASASNPQIDSMPPPSFLTLTASVDSLGESGGHFDITATLDVAATSPMTVRLSPDPSGDSSYPDDWRWIIPGNEHRRASPPFITFRWGEREKAGAARIVIMRDAIDEADETIFITAIDPEGGAPPGITVADAVFTIVDDDYSLPVRLFSFAGAALVGSPIMASLSEASDRDALADAGAAWVWERKSSSPTDVWSSESIDQPSPSHVYVPTMDDVGMRLRARVRYGDYDADTPNGAKGVTPSIGPALPRDPPTPLNKSAAMFKWGSGSSPRVGKMIVAGLVDPFDRWREDGVSSMPWYWERCEDAGGVVECVFAPDGATYRSYEYIPVEADVGKYLRAVVYYNYGGRKRAEIITDGKVQPAAQ